MLRTQNKTEKVSMNKNKWTSLIAKKAEEQQFRFSSPLMASDIAERNVTEYVSQVQFEIEVDSKTFEIKIENHPWYGITVYNSGIGFQLKPAIRLFVNGIGKHALMDEDASFNQGDYDNVMDFFNALSFNEKIKRHILDFTEELISCHDIMATLLTNKLSYREALGDASPHLFNTPNISNILEKKIFSEDDILFFQELGFHKYSSGDTDYIDLETCVTFIEGSESSRADFCPHIVFNTIDKEMTIELGINEGDGWEPELRVLIDETTPWGDAVMEALSKVSLDASDKEIKIPDEVVEFTYALAAKLFPMTHEAVVNKLNDTFFKVVKLN